MAQLFIAQELEKLLRFWEDQNLCGDFNFQIKEKHMRDGGKPLKDSKYVAMIGSELSKDGYLAKAIEDYEMLRKVLMGVSYTHKNDFQPRIPKELRGYFPAGNKDFLNYANTKVPVKISNFLLAWNETRRACIVDKSVSIPRVNLNEEEWLTCLPYPAFYLKVDLQMTYYDITLKSEAEVSNLLVYEEGEMINILAWPKSIDHNCLSDDERHAIKEATLNLRKNKKVHPAIVELTGKAYREFSILISIKKGTSMIKAVTGNGIISYHDLYGDPSLPGDSDLEKERRLLQRKNFLTIAETLNGFCRVNAELPARPAVKILEGDHSHPTQQQSRQWFELPQQVVESFTAKKEDRTVIIRTCGGEMPAHLRRGHYREYKNGLRIWINSLTVRKDKLEKEQLQGGALKIK